MFACVIKSLLKILTAALRLLGYAVSHPRQLAYLVAGLVAVYWLLPWFVPYPVKPEKVWQLITQESPRYGLDPGFVYAIACAESSLNGLAVTWRARGIMQLTRPAWKQVNPSGYWRAWLWQDNLRCGMAYLGYCKQFLEYRDQFSYPLLAACYRYGTGAVEKARFNIDALGRPAHPIYRQLFAGNKRPVMAPVF
jgi:soluble lytic murein transglycosylase-like protein